MKPLSPPRIALALAILAGQSACLVEFPERGPERDDDNVFVYDGTDARSGTAPGEVPPGGPPTTPPDPEGVAPPGGPPTKPPFDPPDASVHGEPDGAVANPRGCVEGICARCSGGRPVVPEVEEDCPLQDCDLFPFIEQGLDASERPFCRIRPTRLSASCQEFSICAVASPRTCALVPDQDPLREIVAPTPCYVIDGCVPGGVPVARVNVDHPCPGGHCDTNGACVAAPAPANCAELNLPESARLCGPTEQPADACRFRVFPTEDEDWNASHPDWPNRRSVHCGNFCRSIGLNCTRVIENINECNFGSVCVWLGRPGNTCELPPEACEQSFWEIPLDGLVVQNGLLCDCR